MSTETITYQEAREDRRKRELALEQKLEKTIRPRVLYQLQTMAMRPAEHAIKIPGKHDHEAWAIGWEEQKIARSHPNLCYADYRCWTSRELLPGGLR